MKLFFLLITFSASLFSTNINESLLSIHATLVPKISLLDINFAEKLDNNAITIVLYYDNSNYNSAKLLKQKIMSKYKNGLKEHPINVKLTPYSKPEKLKANISYLFPSTRTNIKKILKNLHESETLSFSYSIADLALGSMISLDIGVKVKPIINLHAIKDNNISLHPILLKISTIYQNKRVD